MNHIKFLFVAGLAVMVFVGIGCNNGSDVADVPLDYIYAHQAPKQTLWENTWKLTGIVDAKTGSLTELEPKDCKECYTLTFDTDTTYSYLAAPNWGFGSYNYEEHSFRITDQYGTEMYMEGSDEGLWYSILRTIESFSLLENELRLYYNGGRKYLKFELSSELDGGPAHQAPEQTLKGTTWKLVGIGNLETKIGLRELEPKDCEKCYTLIFDTDSSFLGFSLANEFFGVYRKVDKAKNSGNVRDITVLVGTRVGTISEDNDFFERNLWGATMLSFSIEYNELRMFNYTYSTDLNFRLVK